MTPPCAGTYPVRNISDLKECEDTTAQELDDVLVELNVSSLDLVMLHGPNGPDFDYAGPCSESVCAQNAAQWRASEGRALDSGLVNVVAASPRRRRRGFV